MPSPNSVQLESRCFAMLLLAATQPLIAAEPLRNRIDWRSSNAQWNNCKSATQNSRRKSAASRSETAAVPEGKMKTKITQKEKRMSKKLVPRGKTTPLRPAAWTGIEAGARWIHSGEFRRRRRLCFQRTFWSDRDQRPFPAAPGTDQSNRRLCRAIRLQNGRRFWPERWYLRQPHRLFRQQTSGSTGISFQRRKSRSANIKRPLDWSSLLLIPLCYDRTHLANRRNHTGSADRCSNSGENRSPTFGLSRRIC